MAANEKTALVGDKDSVTFKKNKCSIFSNVKAVAITFSVILVVVICAFTVAYINLKSKRRDMFDVDGKSLDASGPEGRACADRNKNCASWQKRGECTKNPRYMLSYCKASCGRCNRVYRSWSSWSTCIPSCGRGKKTRTRSCPVANRCPGPASQTASCASAACTASGPSCVDKKKFCLSWKKGGYCKTNYKYMVVYCKASCGFCQECVDKNTQCARWQKNGECKKNPKYMLVNCKASCGVCGGKKKCGKDNKKYLKECKKWAASGDCKKKTTKKWMKKNCDCSCQTVKKRHKKHLKLNGKYCGLKLNIGRIVGGTEAEIGDWPWQVGIVKKGNTQLAFCGGTLINSRTVLTAAHCFRFRDNPDAALYAVRVGEVNLNLKEEGEEIVNVKKIIKYQGFSLYNYRNDITVIILEKDVTDKRFVGEACVPNSRTTYVPPVGKKCFITGWGRLKDDGRLPNMLQEATVPIVNHKVCEIANEKYLNVTKTMICAGYPEGKIDACQGDSGGPLVCKYPNGKYYLQGITSWGIGCAAKDKYGIYTNVRDYDTWIKNALKSAK